MPTDLTSIPGSYTLYRVNRTTGATTEVGKGNYTNVWRWQRETTKGKALALPNGWRQPTAYQLLETLTRAPTGSHAYVQGSTYYQGMGDYGDAFASSGAPVTSFPTSLRQQAEVDALLSLKDQKINLAVAWAERAKTAQMVGDVASRIARAYRSARRGNLKRAASQLGASWRKSTGNWLELQYGWKPLLSDVHGACEALAASAEDPYQWLITVKGKKSQHSRTVEYISAGVPQFRRETDYFDGAFVRLDYLPGNSFIKTVTSLGLTNPLEVQWETVPFSFVVDWFLPIGDWLGTLDATAGLQFQSGSCSLLTRNVRKMIPNGISSSYSEGYNRLVGGSGKVVRLNRTIYTSSPIPRLPAPKNPVSLGHMANGLSLLAQAFGRGR